ncbi:histone-lysine N-methyltransferase EZA1 isoform X2 [Mercurialis annua]|nr:histone-lysine N-methyltransferase EZA1 isoform X2 [Mercurialis annua]
MAEDQSVVGRRRIYYDQHGSEALICSDSEEDIADPEDERHDFSEGEDRILWMVFQEHDLTEEVANLVSQFIGVSTSDVQERCSILREKFDEDQNGEDSSVCAFEKGLSLGKSLTAALDSFDNLFCRRCLLFDCRLHGCSQTLINPSEKQPYWSEYEDDRKPCGDLCFLQLRAVKDLPEGSVNNALNRMKTENLGMRTKSAGASNAETPSDADGSADLTIEASEASNLDAPAMVIESREHVRKRKALELTNLDLDRSTLVPCELQDSSSKKQKKLLDSDAICEVVEEISSFDDRPGTKRTADKSALQMTIENTLNDPCDHASTKIASAGIEKITCDSNDTAELPELNLSLSTQRQLEVILHKSEWQPFEKELYLKGVEIFGKNSCLIARNLLSGLKTCIEVSNYMCDIGTTMPHKSIAPSLLLDDNGKTDIDYTEQEMPTRSRLLRRRGRTRKLKYSWKSAGHPASWKKIADGKTQSCKQYTPCGCQPMCGKQCPCLHNGNCCEKYCGCSKSCKNRFRGCHCAKSQCRSRQCPCFAAGRECDPDVCRNCWVSCGDGSLGEPPRRGDGQCGNMRLLLRQQQRILLANSDIAGWGAFLKNSVNKNDYLGEYTGELISHREADKRGKIYDRANSSFLFDLNEQYVLDAYRKGDKLKFANHSSNPNCYAKVMLVAGDHRVGIFAKEHIEAREELFYDYRYGPDQAPAWARKPEGSERDDSTVSQGRAKKHQSH